MSGPDLIPITAGQQWAVPKPGPWGGHHPPVAIVDAREGFVRYAFADGTDNAMEEPNFRAIYVPVQA